MDQAEKDRLDKEAAESALEQIKKIAEEKGLTAHKILETLAKALDATEVKPIKTTVFNADGKSKSHRIRYTKKLIAWGPRLRAAEVGANILRLMPKQEIEHSGTVNYEHHHKLSPEIQEKLDAVYAKASA